MKIIFLLLFGLLFSGCSYYYTALDLDCDTTNYPRFAHNRIKKQDKDGLVVAAEDFSNKDKSKRYFYRNLLSMGYIPIYLCLDNRGTAEFTIRAENIIYRFEDGTEAPAANFKDVIDDAQYSYAGAIPLFLFAIWPGITAVKEISEANDKLDQDYSQKAFRNIHLMPEDHIFGFLFFKMPKGQGASSLKEGTLEVKADKKASQGEMAATIKLTVAIDSD